MKYSVLLSTMAFVFSLIYAVFGYFVCFTMGANDTVWTVIAAIVLFSSPLIASLISFRWLKTAGWLLLGSAAYWVGFVLLAVTQMHPIELSNYIRVLGHMYYLPQLILGCLFLTATTDPQRTTRGVGFGKARTHG